MFPHYHIRTYTLTLANYHLSSSVGQMALIKTAVPVASTNNVNTKVHRPRHSVPLDHRAVADHESVALPKRDSSPQCTAVVSLTFHARSTEITIFKVLYGATYVRVKV